MAKQERARRTYELLLDAAAAEFARRGYVNANLQVVADRTGLTKGALYGHFSSKEKIAAALVAHLDEVLRSPPPSAEAKPQFALEELRTFSLGLARRIQQEVRISAALRLVLEEAQVTGKPPRVLEQLQQTAVDLVRRAQQEGDLDPTWSPATIADLLTTLLFGAHYAGPATGNGDLLRRIHAFWDLLLPLLRTRPTR
jgi:AcrR family transcriptional regulator